MKNESDFIKSVHDKYDAALKLEAKKRIKLQRTRILSSVAAVAACACLVFAGVHYLPKLDGADNTEINETVLMFAAPPAGAFESETDSDSKNELNDSELLNPKMSLKSSLAAYDAANGDIAAENNDKADDTNGEIEINSFNFDKNDRFDSGLTEAASADSKARYLVASKGVFEFSLPVNYTYSENSPSFGTVEYLADNGDAVVYAFLDEPKDVLYESEQDSELVYCMYLEQRMIVLRMNGGDDKLILLLPCEYFDEKAAIDVADSMKYTDTGEIN